MEVEIVFETARRILSPATKAGMKHRREGGRWRHTRLTFLAAIAISAMLALPAGAGAAASQTELRPDDFSAADQYKESVPTSRGPSVSAVDRADSSPLPSSVAALLRSDGGAAAATLEQAATSSRFGAPQRKLKSPHGRADIPSVPSAAVSAVDGSGGGELPWLVIALLAITGVVAGTAAHRRYQNRQTTDRG